MQDEPSNRHAPATWRARCGKTVWVVATGVIWLKVAIDLTLRDRIPIVAMVHYAVPPIVLAVAAGLLAWLGRRLQRSRPAIVALWFMAAAATLLWVHDDFRLASDRDRYPGSVRLVFWNVGRGWYARSDKIAERLKHFDADVLALVEATSDEMQSARYWRARLPDYSPVPLDDGIVLLVRGQATLRASGSLRKRGEYRCAEITVLGANFDLLLADIVSVPWKSRLPPLNELAKIMGRQANRPTVVVGDFNTPPSSIAFESWRCQWSRAWEVAGIGYQPTWPQPIPVLTLDQVWGNAWVRFHRSVGAWTRRSDHRPIVVDFSVIMPLRPASGS